ncbi:MAG: hypothetical protein KDC05_11450 [Bacteroidales bacterium]|nr:hypothetical protein [Bacteroidales bacterium]
MKKIFQNLFTSEYSDIPPVVEKKFKSLFKQAESIDWMYVGNEYEALFYENKLEKIARFNPEGTLVEIRINHAVSDFPQSAVVQYIREGTVMNYIEIIKDNKKLHELIVKNESMNRFLVLFDENFEVIKQSSL